MIHEKLGSANLPAKVTSQRRHVVKELVEDEIRKYEGGKICTL
jgi:hypothetical protein